MAEQETPKGTRTETVEVDSAVHDPLAARDDDTARERSTSPVPRVGDTWEDMAPSDEEKSGPRRRVGILGFEDDHALVVNKSTRVESSIRVDRFKPPFWRFIG